MNIPYHERILQLGRRVGHYPLIRQLPDPDLDSIIDRYCHGDCHAFTIAAARHAPRQGRGRLCLVRSANDGSPVHSSVIVQSSPEGNPLLLFDAGGFLYPHEIRDRYRSATFQGESLLFDCHVNVGHLSRLIWSETCDTVDDDLADAEYALDFILGRIESAAGHIAHAI